jgi:hypothetical protein
VDSTWISLLLAGLVVALLLVAGLVVLARRRAAIRRAERRPTGRVVPSPPAGEQDEKTAAGQSPSGDASQPSEAYWTQGIPHRHRFARLLHRRHHDRAA